MRKQNKEGGNESESRGSAFMAVSSESAGNGRVSSQCSGRSAEFKYRWLLLDKKGIWFTECGERGEDREHPLYTGRAQIFVFRRRMYLEGTREVRGSEKREVRFAGDCVDLRNRGEIVATGVKQSNEIFLMFSA